jgi:hypothetical protein
MLNEMPSSLRETTEIGNSNKLLFEWSTNVRPCFGTTKRRSSDDHCDRNDSAKVGFLIIAESMNSIVYMDKHAQESRGTKVNALILYHVFSLLAIENGSYSFHGNITFVLPRKSSPTINDESIDGALESGETLSRLNL